MLSFKPTSSLFSFTFIKRLFIYLFTASKQFSLLFAQGQLLQALRPQDFQKRWGWGESPCLPGAACPILLPSGDGRVDKLSPCTIKYLNFVCVSRSIVSNSETPRGSSVQGIPQARVLERFAIYCSSSRGSLIPLCFLLLGGVVCISEVIDISPGSLDSSLCFLQPSVSHDVLCI